MGPSQDRHNGTAMRKLEGNTKGVVYLTCYKLGGCKHVVVVRIGSYKCESCTTGGA